MTEEFCYNSDVGSVAEYVGGETMSGTVKSK